MSEVGTRRIGIVLVPDFALASFSMIIEPLRIANRLSGKPLYEWSLLSGEGGMVASSAGIELMTRPIAEARDSVFDLAMVCAGFHAERFRHAGILNWLRRHRRLGKDVGAVSTGTWSSDHRKHPFRLRPAITLRGDRDRRHGLALFELLLTGRAVVLVNGHSGSIAVPEPR